MKKLLPKSVYFSNVINVINIIVEDRLPSSSKIPLPLSLHLQVLQELLLINTFRLNKSSLATKNDTKDVSFDQVVSMPNAGRN